MELLLESSQIGTKKKKKKKEECAFGLGGCEKMTFIIVSESTLGLPLP